MTRSNLASVRNPLLQLPAATEIASLPPDAKAALRRLLLDLRRQAREQADKSWRTHKAPMACYWKVVSVLAGHAARLAR